MGMQRLDMFEYVWIIELIHSHVWFCFNDVLGLGPGWAVILHPLAEWSFTSWGRWSQHAHRFESFRCVDNIDYWYMFWRRSRQILTSDSFSSFLGTNKWWSPFARSWHFPCCSQWITFTPAVSYIESHGRTNVWNDENAQNSFGDGGCQKWDRMQMQQLPDVFCEHWTSYWSAA